MHRLVGIVAVVVLLSLTVAAPVAAGDSEQGWYSKDYATTVPCTGDAITWHLDIHYTTVRYDDPDIGPYIKHETLVAHGYGVDANGQITYRMALPSTSTYISWTPTAQIETVVSRTMYVAPGSGPVVAYPVAWHFTWVDGVLVASWASSENICP